MSGPVQLRGASRGSYCFVRASNDTLRLFQPTLCIDIELPEGQQTIDRSLERTEIAMHGSMNDRRHHSVVTVPDYAAISLQGVSGSLSRRVGGSDFTASPMTKRLCRMESKAICTPATSPYDSERPIRSSATRVWAIASRMSFRRSSTLRVTVSLPRLGLICEPHRAGGLWSSHRRHAQ